MCIIILDEEDIYPDGIAITHTSLNRARATVGSVSDGVRIHRAQKLAPDRAHFWFRQRFVNTSRHISTIAEGRKKLSTSEPSDTPRLAHTPGKFGVSHTEKDIIRACDNLCGM